MDVEAIIRGYFAGEKSEAALILLAGVVCLLAALWLWFWVRQPFTRGLAASLLLVAVLGLGVGGSVYFRTDTQVRQLLELQRRDPGRFAAQEGPRIREVVKSFGAYRICYAVAVLLALVLVFAVGRPAYHGLAVGLLVLAALGFTIDYYAEARAVDYVKSLEAAGALPPG
jgi:drug/metabolite transporter (DMT)-like permease